MRSRMRLARHPVHPMVVAFPIAILPLLVVLDGIHVLTGEPALWTAGGWLAAAGILTTIAAIVTGLPDLAGIPNGSRAHRIAVYHFIMGFVVLAIYVGTLALRYPLGTAPTRVLVTTAVDAVGLVLVVVQGFLGAELVYRHHLGVLNVEEGGIPTPFDRPTRAARRASAPRRGNARP